MTFVCQIDASFTTKFLRLFQGKFLANYLSVSIEMEGQAFDLPIKEKLFFVSNSRFGTILGIDHGAARHELWVEQDQRGIFRAAGTEQGLKLKEGRRKGKDTDKKKIPKPLSSNDLRIFLSGR